MLKLRLIDVEIMDLRFCPDSVAGIGHDHFRVARYLQRVNNGISILQAFLPTFQALVSQEKIAVLTESEMAELI